jgi:hypothetical protein
MHGQRAAAVKGLILSASIVGVIFSVSRFPMVHVPRQFQLASCTVTATARPGTQGRAECRQSDNAHSGKHHLP